MTYQLPNIDSIVLSHKFILGWHRKILRKQRKHRNFEQAKLNLRTRRRENVNNMWNIPRHSLHTISDLSGDFLNLIGQKAVGHVSFMHTVWNTEQFINYFRLPESREGCLWPSNVVYMTTQSDSVWFAWCPRSATLTLLGCLILFLCVC